MKKIAILLLVVLTSSGSYAQDEALKFKFDSIIAEADLLYSYEKVAWISTDIHRGNKKLKKSFGGYIVTHSHDTVTGTFFNERQTGVTARYYFTTSDLDMPFKTEIKETPVRPLEAEMLRIKGIIGDQLSNPEYDIRLVEGFDPNFVLIKTADGYKLYIIMGSSKSDIIPFGNDYLLIADKEGNITDHKKFHMNIIPAETKFPDGGVATEITHSHKLTPYISTTDICTFRLYAPFTELKSFKVFCSITDKVYRYDLETNKIELSEL